MIRSWPLITLLVMGVLVSGCAKRPSMAQVSAPAPPASATAVTPGPAVAAPETQQGPGEAGGAARAVVAREAPSEFVAIPEVRDIYFDFDEYAIRPGDAIILDANAAWLRANPGHLVLIEGHCDERGTEEYNLALGERRAKATMDYLISRGIAAPRISVLSYGEERPTCTASEEACWAQNRRAHFLVKRQ